MFLARSKAFDAEALPWTEMLSALRPALISLVEDATAAAIATALTRGLDFDVDSVTEAVAELVPGYVKDWEKEIVASTTERVSAMVKAYEVGVYDLDEMMDRVDKLFDPERAELIAVTETTRIFDVVNQIVNAEAGVEKVRFLTVRDPWVCPECAQYDNQVFDVDELPEIPVHPNCRCFAAPVVREATSRQPVTVAA